MAEEMFELLEPSSIFEKKLPTIIEAFVDYYGEDRREEITKKFKSAVIVKICNNIDLARIISNIKRQVFKDVFQVDGFHFDGDEFLEAIDSEIFKYVYISGDVKQIIDGDFGISSEEFFRNYKAGKYPKLEEYVQKYRTIKERLAPYEKERQENQVRLEEVRFNTYKKLVDEYRDLFSDEEYQEFLDTRVPTFSMKLVLGYDVRSVTEAFSEASDKIFNDPDSSDWQKESYKDDRTLLATLMYHRDPNNPKRMFIYEDFIRNPELTKYMDQAREFYNKLEARKKELTCELNMLETEALADYQRNKKYYKWSKLANKDIAFGPWGYKSGCACFDPNFIKTARGLKYVPFIVVSMNFDDLDMTIMHEFNHLLECSFHDLTEEGATIVTGWDEVHLKFKDKMNTEAIEYQGITRPREFLSEYINEKIDNEITLKMHDKGDFLFTHESQSGSSYLVLDRLFNDFFQTYKPAIIESRREKSFNVIIDRIGQENFDELNNIANDFFKEFGMDIAIWADYAQQQTSPEVTDKINKLIERKQKVMASIVERDFTMGHETEPAV